MKKETIPIICIVLFVIFLAAGIVFWKIEASGITKSNAPDEEDLPVQQEITEDPKEDIHDIALDDTKEPPVEEEPEEIHELVENPYKDYYKQNEDMAGWLVIPDTVVDYPVMWTPENEEFYLFKDFNKNYSESGCLILDTDSNVNPLTTNLIIHGHHMKNGMFGKLEDYESKEYRDEHPYIYFHTRECERVYEIMAVFRSKVYYQKDDVFKYYKFFQANTKAQFDDFYDNVKKLSEYDTGVTASYGDRFITLSTCAYHTDNGRFVVVGKEIEPGAYYEPFE